MKRGIVLNWSLFTAIFLMSYFNESDGFPLDLSTSERLTEFKDSSMLDSGVFGDRYEAPVAHSRDTREVDNDKKNLLDTSSKATKPNLVAFGRPPPGPNIFSLYDVDRGIVVTAYNTSPNEIGQRSKLPFSGQYNPAEVDHGMVLAG